MTHLTGADDSTMFWDYLSQNPESVHQVMILMGDRGIPDGFRHMNGYYGHTLKIVNDVRIFQDILIGEPMRIGKAADS